MRTFEASTLGELSWPVEVLGRVATYFHEQGFPWVLIGAAARDIVLRGAGCIPPARATRDIDPAVGVDTVSDHTQLVAGLGSGGRPWQRTTVEAVPVDVLPFGGVESAGVVRIAGVEFGVVGLQESAANPDRLVMCATLHIPVASIEMQAVLKVMAFESRRPGEGKDAGDLRLLLRGASDGHYSDEVWADEDALRANEHQHDLAAAWRLGRGAASLIRTERLDHVRATALAAADALILAWRGRDEALLDGWLRGLGTNGLP